MSTIEAQLDTAIKDLRYSIMRHGSLTHPYVQSTMAGLAITLAIMALTEEIVTLRKAITEEPGNGSK